MKGCALLLAWGAAGAVWAGPIKTISMVTGVRTYSSDPRWPRFAAEAGLTTLGTHIHGYDVTGLLMKKEGKAFVANCDRYGLTLEHELHAYWELLPRKLFETHPEYFPVWNADGVTRYRGNNCCPSSPEAVEIICSNALRLAQSWAHGEKTCRRYFFWPDDLTGPCKCLKCRDLNAGDQALIVENALIARLRTWDPRAQVAHLAYGAWCAVPKKVKPAEGVFLEYAPIERPRSGPIDENTLGELKALLEVFPVETAQVLEYWLDAGLFSRWTAPSCRLPWNPGRLRADIDTYARLGIRHFASFGLTTEYIRAFGEKHTRKVLAEYAAAFREWPYEKKPDDNARLQIEGFLSYEKDDAGEYFRLVGGDGTFDFRERTGEILRWRPVTGGEVKFIPATNGLAGTFDFSPRFGFAPVVRVRTTTLGYDLRPTAAARKHWNVDFFLHQEVTVSGDTINFSRGYRHAVNKPTGVPARTFPDVRIQKPANVTVSDLRYWSVRETETEIVITQDAIPPEVADCRHGVATGFSLRAGRRLSGSDLSEEPKLKNGAAMPLPKGFSWSGERSGRGGKPGCLVWTGDDAKAPRGRYLAWPCAGVRSGAQYDASVWVKVADEKGKDIAGEPDAPSPSVGGLWAGRLVRQDLASVVRWNQKTVQARAYEMDKEGWRRIVVRMMMPVSSSAGVPILALNAQGKGTILFDDIEVREIGHELVGALRTGRFRDEADAGSVRFAALTYAKADDIAAGRVRAVFSYTAADGAVRTVPAAVFDDDHAELTLDARDLAVGMHPVELTLLAADGQRLGASRLDFTRLEKPSARTVRFDAEHRTLVNGKPFFPLGMFVHRREIDVPHRMEVFVRPKVFNTVLTYYSRMTSDELDRFAELGLMVIPSLNDHYEPAASSLFIEDAPTPEAADAWTEEVVTRCRHHPALLGWYVLDEKPAYMKRAVLRKYHQLRRLDPNHPSFMVTWDQNETRAYMDAVDVTGLDKYVLFRGEPGKRPAQEVGFATETVGRATLGLQPIWVAPQAYIPSSLAFPTPEEMRAQTWQAIAAGANGIIYYSFGEMDHRTWGATNRDPPTEAFLAQFKTVCDAAAEVKAQFDVLLSDPSPAVWRDAPKDLLLRAWKLAKGRTAILICNRYPRPCAGKVALTTGFDALDARMGGGVALSGKDLTLDLPAFGVALVELR